MNDIVLLGKWTPVVGFEGVFDGGGHAISNLDASRIGGNFIGLFATSTAVSFVFET